MEQQALSGGGVVDVVKERESLLRIRDRLLATPQDKIESVLNVLLPKLAVMANTPQLKDPVMVIVTIAIDRIREWKLIIAIENLIGLICGTVDSKGQIVCEYSSEIAVSLVDAAIEHYPKTRHELCVTPLLAALDSVPLFSAQSDSLCNYALHFIDALARRVGEESLADGRHAGALDVLGDWFLDIALVTGGISNAAVGSVQHGLSSKRSNRLTVKIVALTAVQIRKVKLELIASLTQPWLPAKYCVAIALACSLDADEQVATQATHKVRGTKSLFKLDSATTAVDVLQLLLLLCGSFKQLGSHDCGSVPRSVVPCAQYERTPLRADLVATILHFVKVDLLPIIGPDVENSVGILLRYFAAENVIRTGSVGSVGTADLRITASWASLMDAFHELLSNKYREIVLLSYSKLAETTSMTSRELQLVGPDVVAVNAADSMHREAKTYFGVISRLVASAYTVLKNLESLRISFVSSTSSFPFVGTCLHHLCKLIDRTVLLAPYLLIQFPLSEVVAVLLSLLSQYGLSSSSSSEAGGGASSIVNEKDEYFVAANNKTQGDGKVFYDAITTLLGSLGSLKQLYFEAIQYGKCCRSIMWICEFEIRCHYVRCDQVCFLCPRRYGS
jgi:hypothetical protein